MATAARLGFPAINDPRGSAFAPEQLRGLQQIVGNVRERFRNVDAAISTLQSTTVTTTTAQADLKALKKQIENLQAELDALEEVVAGLTTGGFETDPRTEQIAGELLEIRDALETDPAPDPRVEQLAGELQAVRGELASVAADPGRLPAVEATVAALKRQVDDIDPVGQTAAHSAMLQSLQDQIRSINLGVLL